MKVAKDGAIYPDRGTGDLELDFSLTLSQMYLNRNTWNPRLLSLSISKRAEERFCVCQPPTFPKYVESQNYTELGLEPSTEPRLVRRVAL